MHGLATFLYLGKNEDAEKMFRRVMEIGERVFQAGHETINAMCYRTCTLWRLERYDEARELQDKLVEKLQGLFGQDHRRTITIIDAPLRALNRRQMDGEAEALAHCL
jgi:hypothetical protein